MEESFGEAVRRLRGAVQLSLRGLAKRAYVDPGLLSKVENGIWRPSAQVAKALDDALNADGALVGLARAIQERHGARQPPVVRPVGATADELAWLDEINGVTETQRRELLKALLSVPLLAAIDGKLPAKVVTVGFAQALRGLPPKLYALDDENAGDTVRTITHHVLRMIDDALNEAEYTEAAGRDLMLAYGELAEMAGWLEYDALRNQQSRYFLGEALRAAHLADDLQLEVLVLASMTMQSRASGRPREAVRLAQLAKRRAAGWGTPRLMSLLAAREAIGWAQAGDASAAQGAINRALHAFDDRRRPDDPAWISFYSAAELGALQSSMASFLGWHQQAIDLLHRSIEAITPAYARNRALYRVRLALAYLGAGARNAAWQTLSDDLRVFTGVHSARVSDSLGICIRAASHDRSPSAQGLVEQARSLELVIL